MLELSIIEYRNYQGGKGGIPITHHADIFMAITRHRGKMSHHASHK